MDPPSQDNEDLLQRALAYDQSINWSARLSREIPVLLDVFGPPGEKGLLDAGCGSGRQVCAMTQAGYRVVGLDASAQMLIVAKRVAAEASIAPRFVQAAYAEIPSVGQGFDGVYCIANSLAAAASQGAAREAVARFGECLRPGGRLFVQVLNFPPMRNEYPCVRGPRIAAVDGQEFVSLRHFTFDDHGLTVTNLTVWNDGGWHQRSATRRLYPLERDELCGWVEHSDMRIDEAWGSYAREPFDAATSVDLIVVATKQ